SLWPPCCLHDRNPDCEHDEPPGSFPSAYILVKALYYACSVKSSFLFHGFSELSNFSELSKMNQDTPNGHESPVGADLSAKRRLRDTRINWFIFIIGQTRNLPRIPTILLIFSTILLTT